MFVVWGARRGGKCGDHCIANVGQCQLIPSTQSPVQYHGHKDTLSVYNVSPPITVKLLYMQEQEPEALNVLTPIEMCPYISLSLYVLFCIIVGANWRHSHMIITFPCQICPDEPLGSRMFDTVS